MDLRVNALYAIPTRLEWQDWQWAAWVNGCDLLSKSVLPGS